MSKEATGENGVILGSGEYCGRVNRSTLFSNLMRRSAETNYYETLRKAGGRAEDMIEEIYDDLQEHKRQLSYIDSGRRNQLQNRLNHYELSDDAYNAVKDLKNLGKKVRIAGKVLLVAGVALDVLELGTTIDADLKDADGKLGKQTLSTAASIGGSWAGAALGAKLGALAGAATGPAAPIAVPVLGLVGGIGGAFGEDALGKWIVDITCAED